MKKIYFFYCYLMINTKETVSLKIRRHGGVLNFCLSFKMKGLKRYVSYFFVSIPTSFTEKK